MIKIMFADDHDLIREGLKKVLSYEEDLEIISDLRDGIEIVELLEKNENIPDIILLDINMEKLDGIKTLRTIKEKWPEIKVIMLTVENERRKISEAIKIGADGYVLKESAGSEITNAIRTVYSGGKYIDNSLINMLFMQKSENENNKLDILTKRESIILMEISNGLKNKEIGEKLFLSEKTVKNYVTGIFKKISVQDRVQATIFALENDIKGYINIKYN